MSELTAPAPWRRVSTGDATVAVAERAALGTSARVAVWPPENLGGALAAVDSVLSALDRQASRFRQDSEISWIHRSGGGLFMLSDGLAEAISVALEAARWTGGLADPTVGDALISLGYDRDFAAIDPERREPAGRPAPAPGWQTVRLEGPLLQLAGRRPARSGCHRQGPGIRPCGQGGHGRERPGRRRAGQPRGRHGRRRAAAPRRLANSGGRRARPGRLIASPAGPAGQRGGRDLVDHLPPVAAGRPRAAPHCRSPDRASRGRAMADGERCRGHVCRRQRRGHSRDRRRRRGQRNGWPRRACRRGSSPTTGRCATQAAGQTPTVTASTSHRAAMCMAEQDREACGKAA